MTTTTDIARRGGTPHAAGAALAIRGGQTTWDDKQRAALVAMGVNEKATNAELAVFFHQCQRSGLDPFTRQIYLIHRPEKNADGRYVLKPTTQTGIDGYRLIRDRIARRDGIRVEYEDTLWYDADGGAHEAWLWDDPPAACKVAISVDGRRFSSVLRYAEYAQRKKDGEINSMWRTKAAHMIEKCAEADVLRRAFPQDLSGLVLEDAAPLDDPDAPPVRQQRGVTAEQIRQRRTVTAAAETVTLNPSPADGSPPSAEAPPPQAPAGEAPPALLTSGQKSQLDRERQRLGYGDTEQDWDDWLADLAALAGLAALATPGELTQDEAASVIRRLKTLPDTAALRQLLGTGEAPQDAGQEAGGDGE